MLLKDLLKELRESRGLNKQELANKVDISRSYISTIESGKVEKPTKKTLMKIAYVFDPDDEQSIYSALLEASGYDTESSKEEYRDYINEMSTNFQETKKFNGEVISGMKYRVNKHDNSVVFLDKPYMNVLWLLEQEDFKVYLGYEDDEFFIDDNGTPFNKPLELDDEDKNNLLIQVHNFQSNLLLMKKALKNKNDIEALNIESMEYTLIFDLLNNRINDKNELISKLAVINKEREIFNAKEYHEELDKAAQEQDALKLQRLIRMTTIVELKQYLSEQNKGD
ncbi:MULTISPECIES: helix-turn-helix transcriptional regulator [Staphylococcus]|uniref:helix-turn-helix transcriptional regulator n=1 Tax=Staphylococcus TaxID=1279 RepID=UPI00157E0A50|nr:helix-turn-helix transcriptional regulator [Staphylococcus saprophyticus]MDW3805130.1 helix-turn-helix transcriptional regulator [Staphylococcus saprophyticus]MDW3963787.1 helix-turn-helix transcriptional regulator [Staphylococcus saprophyticus]MDW3965759.1 helix-turn-helix transcriptional regulator [Staphylococcus saprophyticus]MDW3975650.1 helix-turn-helix transcriptional regulator [Staphylococcus saprophyticus]MDW4003127.1 helix-turn-helix transcriptional regulator [Staphylococcus saprop